MNWELSINGKAQRSRLAQEDSNRIKFRRIFSDDGLVDFLRRTNRNCKSFKLQFILRFQVFSQS